MPSVGTANQAPVTGSVEVSTAPVFQTTTKSPPPKSWQKWPLKSIVNCLGSVTDKSKPAEASGLLSLWLLRDIVPARGSWEDKGRKRGWGGGTQAAGLALQEKPFPK